MTNSPGARLRALMTTGECLVAPGCHDALSARQVQAAGFGATYLQMYCINACLFGEPNIGYASLAEAVFYARHIAAAVDIPLIVDAATGFGDAISVQRTVREFEAAGAAGIHIEDQLRPWSPTTGIRAPLLSVDEACTKYHAASQARRDPDFQIIAWSFATFESLDESLARCRAYKEAGADVVMPIMSPYMGYSGRASDAGRFARVLTEIVAALPSPVATHTPFGLELSAAEATAAGASLYLLTLPTLGAAAAAVRQTLTALKDGRVAEGLAEHPPFGIADFSGILDIRSYDRLAFEMGFAVRGPV
ncbi:MAG TPA: isocitrate lyase/PEP mutase family protein [Streptosporangiaceae bacterium]|jgi:2-methylisocitrate lyase-like PEP mutase family enzyme